jgi:photosystem II stability/assembly factor-like uncharacterized protein
MVLLCASLACGSSKDDDPDPNPNPNPDPSFWLVGDEGTMIRIDSFGEASGYPLETDADLRAIVCHGERTAYVVGDAGTLVHSRDAGASWTAIDLELDVDWRALAVAEHTPEGAEALWLVGEHGAIVHTPDGGGTWLTVPGASVNFTGVATRAEGDAAIAVADDGTIWALQAEGATLLRTGDDSLRAVAMAAHNGLTVAVGDGGTMLRRRAGEEAWEAVELGTSRDLFAVQVAADASLTLAVGEAGIVVRVHAAPNEQVGRVEQVEHLGQDLALRAVHLGANLRAQAVGDAGTVLLSRDAGLSWSAESLTTRATLRGVDDFHLGGHL